MLGHCSLALHPNQVPWNYFAFQRGGSHQPSQPVASGVQIQFRRQRVLQRPPPVANAARLVSFSSHLLGANFQGQDACTRRTFRTEVEKGIFHLNCGPCRDTSERGTSPSGTLLCEKHGLMAGKMCVTEWQPSKSTDMGSERSADTPFPQSQPWLLRI